MPKIKEDIQKLAAYLMFVLKYLTFLGPGLKKLIGAMLISLALIAIIFITTESTCEMNPDFKEMVCDTRTITGLPLELMIGLAIVTGYILSCSIRLIFYMLDKSRLKKL